MKGQTIRQLRQVHNYIGIFFAPAILFFALSGSFQTLGMHEDRGHGKPMAWVEWMGSIHKDQELPRARPPRKPEQHQAAAGKPARPPQHRDSGLSALKVFVLCLALALISSTLLGIVISYTNRKTRLLTSALLGAGALVPIGLLFLQ